MTSEKMQDQSIIQSINLSINQSIRGCLSSTATSRLIIECIERLLVQMIMSGYDGCLEEVCTLWVLYSLVQLFINVRLIPCGRLGWLCIFVLSVLIAC